MKRPRNASAWLLCAWIAAVATLLVFAAWLVRGGFTSGGENLVALGHSSATDDLHAPSGGASGGDGVRAAVHGSIEDVSRLRSPDDSESLEVPGPPEPERPECRVIGRLVDDERRPVAGASIVCFLPDRRTIVSSSLADRFVVALSAFQPTYVASLLCIHAQDRNGRAAVFGFEWTRSVWERSLRPCPDTHDCGTLALVPARAIAVSVKDQGEISFGVNLRVESGITRLPCGVGTTDEEGIASFTGIPLGDVHVRAWKGDRVGQKALFLDREVDAQVHVELCTERRLDVLVCEADTLLPLPGAEVCVMEEMFRVETNVFGAGEAYVRPYREIVLVETRTDEKGRLVIHGLLPRAALRVHARASGFAADEESGDGPWATAQPSPTDNELHLSLRRCARRTLIFPLIAGEVAAPLEGTPLEVRVAESLLEGWSDPFPPSARMASAEIVVETDFPATFQGIAVSPDGSLARLFTEDSAVVGESTSFFKPRSAEVVVRDSTGDPLPGIFVQMNPENTFCPVVGQTSGEGRFRADDLHAGRMEVRLDLLGCTPPDPRTKAGTLDLLNGPFILEYAADAKVEALLRVHIDGEMRLPARYRLAQEGGRRLVAVEHPETGELVVKLHPEHQHGPVEITLLAEGFLSEKIALRTQPRDGPEIHRVDLQPAAGLRIFVVPPPDRSFRVLVQELQEDGASWQWNQATKIFEESKAERWSYRTEPLPAGRYRVGDRTSGLCSEAVEVSGGDDQGQVTLDLSRCAWVCGRVIGPPGEGLRFAEVRTFLPEHAQDPGSAPLLVQRLDDWQSGDFRVRIPGHRPVLLTAWHPRYLPHQKNGSAEILTGKTGIELELVRAAVASFRVAGVPGARNLSTLSGCLFRGSDFSTPAFRLSAVVSDGVASFAGHPAGRFAVWIDGAPQCAPLVIEDVVLTGEDQDLGEWTFPKGSTLRFPVQHRAGQSPSRISLMARHLGLPSYQRHAWVADPNKDFRLPGLGPGRFEVEVRAGRERRLVFSAEIEVDGLGERAIPIDLR